ncbi:MAG: benzoate-CoA ligase family protein [Cytophagales bacterium]|nr:benzoate-CoA ligase family protein [Cytophagales bacterium]
MTTFNFANHLFQLNLERASKVAFIDDAHRLTYGELALQARRTASRLIQLGLRREERVFVLMHDNVDWPIAFLGCLYAGIVPVAVNTLLPADDLAYMLEHSRSRAAIVSEALLPTFNEALAKAPAHEVQHTLVSKASSPQAFLDKGCQPMPNPAPTHPDDIGFWLYSSGSTGKPKGTVHTHANPHHTAELFGKAVLGIQESDVLFSAAKLFFAYGLGNALTFPLSVGATVILSAERPTPDMIFKRWTGDTPALTGLKPTVFFGAPTGYAGMLASPNLPAKSAVALRMCSSAGEALPREIGERFSTHFGCHIVDGIGSTEMLHVYLSNRPDDVRYGTTGKAVAGYTLSLRGDDGREVQDGEVGDLYISGPSAALMYWTRRDKSTETFQGAWLKSGDKYVRDSDGYYTYAGRSDDMFKVSGQYVSPFEVESTLMQHVAVLEAAVVAVADENQLTRAKAYVVLKSGQAASDALRAELQAFVKSKLAPHKYPRQLEFITELPKTATGKIQRFRLRS